MLWIVEPTGMLRRGRASCPALIGASAPFIRGYGADSGHGAMMAALAVGGNTAKDVGAVVPVSLMRSRPRWTPSLLRIEI